MPIYSKSPLIEVLCEFHFRPEPAWEEVFPGLIYEKLREKYPNRKGVQSVSVKVSPESANANIVTTKRSQFWKTDETALVQVSEHFLAVNHLKPYPTWQEYFPMVREALNSYVEIVHPVIVDRILLRYINRFDSLDQMINKTVLNLADAFEIQPVSPESFTPFRNFQLSIDKTMHERDLLRVQLSSVDDPKARAIILDITYSRAAAEGLPVTECETWLENAHREIDNAFEASITERMKALIQ